MKSSKGFTVVEAVLVLVVVAVIGFVGYLAYTNFFAPKDSDTASTSQTSEQAPVDIKSGDDVDKALAELDDMTIEDDSDVTDFDAATKEFDS